MSAPTETWWLELRLWPFVFRVEAEVLLETRPLRPGMRSYQCALNDGLWALWRWADRVRGQSE